MKFALLALSSVLTFASTSAFANTAVLCGTSVDANTLEVRGFELQLASQGADVYAGPVGGTWNLKLGSEQSNWLTASKDVTAKTTKVKGQTDIEITIKMAQTASGPVGTTYKLIDLYNEQPTLEKYTMGGFAGTVKVGTFHCVSSNG